MGRSQNKWQPIMGEGAKTASPAVGIRMTQDGSNLHIEYADGVRVIFPTSNVPKVAAAKVREKRNAQLSSDGKAISWPDIDVRCSVSGIRRGMYGTAKFKAVS